MVMVNDMAQLVYDYVIGNILGQRKQLIVKNNFVPAVTTAPARTVISERYFSRVMRSFYAKLFHSLQKCGRKIIHKKFLYALYIFNGNARIANFVFLCANGQR